MDTIPLINDVCWVINHRNRRILQIIYLSSSFYVCLCSETESRSINSQKRNEANLSSHLDRTKLGQ